jgi:stage II sporulation protein D
VTTSAWAAAALATLHLSSLGALPKEVHIEAARPYLDGRREVRILIADGASAVSIRAQSAMYAEDAQTNARLGLIKEGALLSARRRGATVSIAGPGLRTSAAGLRISPVGQDVGARVSTRGGWGRRGVYPGSLLLTVGGHGLRVVEQVDLETYVSGVVASEMPSHFPEEAAKAQAIAARTYALYHLGGHAEAGADLCGRVHCQAYGGAPASGSRASKAARATAGQVIIWDALLVDAMYHSACGGATATAWEVRQGKLLPYLRGALDTAGASPSSAYCAHDHDIHWTKSYSFVEAERLVRRNLGLLLGRSSLRAGRLEGLEAVKDAAGRRVQWLTVRTDGGTYQVRGDAIRWLFGDGRPGPEGLRSTAFDMQIETAASGQAESFRFSGRGHGHGLGLCQWGARGRALSGQSAYEILAAYYPGTRVVDLSE